jgi:hypothetical protein
MNHQRHFGSSGEPALREAAQIGTLIADHGRLVQILDCDIATEEARVRVSDHSDATSPGRWRRHATSCGLQLPSQLTVFMRGMLHSSHQVPLTSSAKLSWTATSLATSRNRTRGFRAGSPDRFSQHSQHSGSIVPKSAA